MYWCYAVGVVVVGYIHGVFVLCGVGCCSYIILGLAQSGKNFWSNFHQNIYEIGGAQFMRYQK